MTVAEQRLAIDPEVLSRLGGAPVMALVPPDQKGRRSARWTFLDEELQRFAAAGISLHALSPYISESRRIGGVTIHAIPRISNLAHTFRAYRLSRTSMARRLLRGLPLMERLRLARYHQACIEVIGKEKIRVIYNPFCWPAGTGGLIAAKTTGTPLVVTLRGVEVLVEESICYGNMLDPLYAKRIAQVLKQADHVIAVSESLAQRAVELGTDPSRVSVVLKGVDHERFSDGDPHTARSKLGLANRPTILFVGNLIPRKGVDYLIDAYEIVRREVPEAQLVICGDGPEKTAYQQRIDAGGLQEDVRLVGRVDRGNIPDYFRACDLFVLPSLADGSGNVMVEAAATARPIVGTDCTGIPDYVQNGETGLLFRKADAADLADKIRTLLLDDDLRRRLGEAGRARVEREFRYEHMLCGIARIWEKVIEARSAARSTNEVAG